MTESEARLRIEQSYKHGSEIKLGLDQLQVLIQKGKSSHKTRKQKPTFVGPQDVYIAFRRWRNCCIAATKQLYGINQNVSNMKQQLNSNMQDISIMRLMAQTSLKCMNMLKNLLQFPEHLKENPDEPAVVRVVAACSELLSLLAIAGIVDAETSNTDKQEADAAGSSDTSLVESEVIQTLHDEGRVAKHLAHLAAEKLAGKKAVPPSALTAGVGLEGGATLHLLHDSLSNRLAAKAALQQPVPVHRYTVRSSALRSNLQKPPPRKKLPSTDTKQKKASTTSNSRAATTSMAEILKTYGYKPSKKNRKVKKCHTTKIRYLKSRWNCSRESVSEEEEQRERRRLWRELMPLLAHQEVFLDWDEIEELDLKAILKQLNKYIKRMAYLEKQNKCHHELRRSIKEDIKAIVCSDPTEESGIEAAIKKANKLMRDIGFLPANYDVSTHEPWLNQPRSPHLSSDDTRRWDSERWRRENVVSFYRRGGRLAEANIPDSRLCPCTNGEIVIYSNEDGIMERRCSTCAWIGYGGDIPFALPPSDDLLYAVQ